MLHTMVAISRRNRSTSNRSSGATDEAGVLRAKAMRMRIEGSTTKEIAETLGRTQNTISSWIREEVRALVTANADELRGVQHMRYEWLLQKLIPKIKEGDVPAIATAVRIIGSIEDLNGLKMPSRVHVTTTVDPREEQIKTIIDQARERAQQEMKAISDNPTVQ